MPVQQACFRWQLVVAHVLVPDELGVTEAPDCFPTHGDIGDDCDLWERHHHPLARRGRRRHVEFSEPAREGDQGVVVEPFTTEAQYEVVIPGLVNVSENLVVDFAGDIETPDVGTERCPRRKHLNAARVILVHMSLSTSFAMWRVRPDAGMKALLHHGAPAALSARILHKARGVLNSYPSQSSRKLGLAVPRHGAATR